MRHTIELLSPADAIPEFLDGDLTGLDIGDSLHISAITLPAGARPTIADRDFTVATIVAAVRPEGRSGSRRSRGAADAAAATAAAAGSGAAG